MWSVPASWRSAPQMIFMRVDLPAPFSPTTACTSPRRAANVTRSRARVPPKCLVISRASSANSDIRPLLSGVNSSRGPATPRHVDRPPNVESMRRRAAGRRRAPAGRTPVLLQRPEVVGLVHGDELVDVGGGDLRV